VQINKLVELVIIDEAAEAWVVLKFVLENFESDSFWLFNLCLL